MGAHGEPWWPYWRILSVPWRPHGGPKGPDGEIHHVKLEKVVGRRWLVFAQTGQVDKGTARHGQ